MISILGLSINEIEELIAPYPKFRAKQIYNWIIRGVFDFNKMTDIPQDLQNDLKAKFTINTGKIENISEDKETKKIVLSFFDGEKAEAVLIKDGKDRFTGCLSTQAGCPVGCVFCKTGTLGFKRNLACSEIVEQLLYLNNFLSCSHDSNSSRLKINNIVIMGMGEPLLNLKELRKAVSFITDKQSFDFSRRRITVSTCGICSSLRDIAENGPYIRLAVSLVTACEDLRQKLIPVSVGNPLSEIKDNLILFQNNGGGRVTLEIPLLGGINTRIRDAESVFKFSKGLECIVNLIPWNPVAGLMFNGKPLLEPGKKEIYNFKNLLEKSGLKVTIRYRKGRGIGGACGQLGELIN